MRSGIVINIHFIYKQPVQIMSAIASLTLSVSHNTTPYYQQLREQILTAIREKRVKSEERLPSTRNLAKTLGISRSVVTHTYDQLIAEGVLVSMPKRGIFIANVSHITLPSARLNSVAVTDIEKNEGSKGDATPARYFDSSADHSVFPYREWAASVRRSWLNPDPNILMGNYRLGFPALKEQLAKFLHSLRGIECDPSQIIITAGNRDALQLLQHLLKSQVALWYTENPTYLPINASLTGELRGLNIIEGGVSPPDTQATWAAVLTPCRQYPLGVSYSSQYREKWLQSLSEGQGYVIEDDYDNEFIYQGRPTVTLFQAAKSRPYAEERVFYVGSFSKTLFRGLRLSYVVVPKGFVRSVLDSQIMIGQSASLPMQPALSDFIESGAFYRHLNKMRRHYRLKRDFLEALLTLHLSDWFEWEKPTGGMHILLRYKSPLSEDHQHAQRLKSQAFVQGLTLSLLEEHYLDPESAPKGLVLGFSNTAEEDMERWVVLLRDLMTEGVFDPDG
ncbi:MocR-like pyridoxine biosynthesis transcription factor PdxR [Marinomonas mediterranea]|uniref:Transcriptional regulator, GntR family n=1 Tax=Marinomonas mediterranea (strain ATCC 700492 / JCM 21426 / NBRC 103028 / MMB-1) TaxID=717774 RepID=F2JVD1_MARM1|nr:PLP-dependent aminotransferase family protein [Marinomonas mediterranea]ADZ89389.1 transcriptional regulator, GntR family [Marinomonas mediterranea MMB-1]WCN15651.1 aminotransferase class I/II-fold pyridoxal phosphate-dependent enzyme [Marinomonas mediterranea MMB-1]